MHRIKISILGIIVVIMLLHLYSMGNKSVIPPINYSGNVKIQDYSEPVNNIKGLKFPSGEDRKYIYVFIMDEDKLNYQRYDIEAGKEVEIKVPKNKYFFVCFAGESSSKAMWSWYYDYVAPEDKGKFVKLINEGGIQVHTAVLKEIRGERFNCQYAQFFAGEKGTEKIYLTYGDHIKNTLKAHMNIKVE